MLIHAVTARMADAARETAGNDGLAGMARLPEGLLGRLLEAYLKPPLFHELGPI